MHSCIYSPQKVSFLGLTETADANMRQKLLLENVFGILNSFLSGHTWLGSPHSNKVESNILFLNHKSLIQRGLQLYMWNKGTHMLMDAATATWPMTTTHGGFVTATKESLQGSCYKGKRGRAPPIK